MPDILSIIQTVAMVAIPLLSAIVSAFYWLHKRITKIEESSEAARGALYGKDEDPLHIGIAKEVNDMKTQINSLEKEVERLEDELNED